MSHLSKTFSFSESRWISRDSYSDVSTLTLLPGGNGTYPSNGELLRESDIFVDSIGRRRDREDVDGFLLLTRHDGPQVTGCNQATVECRTCNTWALGVKGKSRSASL